MEDTQAGNAGEQTSKALIACFVAPFALLLVHEALGWLDTTTEITPSHDSVLNSCFLAGGIGAVALVILSGFASKGLALWRRIPIACCLGLVGFLAVFLLSSRVANLVEGRIDFPPASTKTYQGYLVIWRAYQTHGKGQSWNIQTTPIWSNLDITQADYNFMLGHRSPDDHGTNPDEITSHGYFCALVTLQQSANALRVLHAGSEALPEGSIKLCPLPPAS